MSANDVSGQVTTSVPLVGDLVRRTGVVSIELSIQGTFLGPFQTPAGVIQPTGAKIDFPTADFWYLRNGKIEVFDCHIAFTTLFAQLGILPDYASAVAASAAGR